MAESTGSKKTGAKNKKTLDAFADDLDAMLNIDDISSKTVGTIDDDEAIDRLLVGDETVERDEQQEFDEFADIDSLLAGDDPNAKQNLADDFDEFGDDFDADIAIHPSRSGQAVDDEFADIVGAENRQEDVELAAAEVFDEVAALERVGEIEDLADEEPVLVASASVAPRDELENMTEIDEFSDDSALIGTHADFLMADFDISADDDFVAPAVPPIDEFAQDEAFPAAEVEPVDEQLLPAGPDLSMVQELSAAIDEEPVEEMVAVPVREAEHEPLRTPPPVQQTPPAPAPVKAVDYSGDISTLNRQIVELKKHQQQIRHDLTELAGKDELSTCLNSLESLQTEQKKTKRGLDALAAKKPVAAYVANGVAVAALLIGTGLGIQGMIAKSQVGELATIIGKLQEQVNVAPASDAADKEMLRKQMDELTVSSGVMSTQIAELSKAIQADAGGGKPGGDLGKQLTELGNQDMQMGAAIEALQNKMSALEKGRSAAAAPVAKAEKKKPEAVQENWAVNLIAFKQDWYAKRKAEEFAGKGVPAKVSKTEAKGESWYRLSVDGFKTQYEAAAYAAKVKKTLNLDSVWVTRNKD